MAAYANSKLLYSDEIINGVRISKILIDIGTELLQKRLIDIILNKNDLYTEYRQDTTSYRSLEHFLDANSREFKNIQYFFNTQIQTMYPNNVPTKSAAKFDITLCCNLYRHLLKPPVGKNGSVRGWNVIPLFDDTSPGANIIRIKFVRDINYGHVHKLGCNIKDLERLETFYSKQKQNSLSLLAKLEHSIYGLCLDSVEKAKYESLITACLSLNLLIIK